MVVNVRWFYSSLEFRWQIIQTRLSRYYTAEIAVWTLSASLVISCLIGLDPSEALPIIHINIGKPQYIPHIIASILLVSSLYLYIEWKQSPKAAKSRILSIVRVIITLLCSGTDLWVAYPTITQNTAFYGVSPAWYLGFILTGTLIGNLVAHLLFSAMMISSKEEARRLKLPRVTRAVKAQFLFWSLVIIAMVAMYAVMHHLAPPVVATLSPALTGFFAAFTVIVDFLDGWHDRSGKRLPWREVIKKIKRINVWHHYEHLLIDRHDEFRRVWTGISTSASPEEHQQYISRKIATAYDCDDRVHFHCTTLDALNIQPIFKDGNRSSNWRSSNIALNFLKEDGSANFIKVLVKFDGEEPDQREVLVPLSLLEKEADRCLMNQHVDLAHGIPRTLLSAVINEATIMTLMLNSSALYHAAMAGKEEYVRRMLMAGARVNEQTEFGWTPLLAAVAQGYTNIVRILLEAGAKSGHHQCKRTYSTPVWSALSKR